MRLDDFSEQFIRQLKEMAPGAAALSEEMRQHMRSAALATFQKLELVTREEFDAQQAVLQRTREKLEALEKEVSALEKQLESNNIHQNTKETKET